MNTQLLKARQTKYAAYAAVYILVVITAIVIVNVLANRYTKSYDATSNKRYSLSEQTAKIVKGLKENATILYFDQGTRFEHAKDLLGEYASLSPKVHVDYVDPDKKPQEAREAGIKNYGTALVQVGDKKEEAKSHDRRRHHRSVHPRAEEQNAHRLFRRRQRRAPDRRLRPQRLFQFQGTSG